MFDVAVIGTGPAGLSAAVGSACEGLNTLCLGAELGGQAGHSSKIENYLGFPEGVSGAALADRSRRQAEKFGVAIVGCSVDRLERDNAGFEIKTGKGTFRARSVILATGAAYNKLDASTGYERFEDGGGVHYACTQREVRRSCQCEDVVVIGGGNSAGQAAMFLSTKAATVHLIIRGGSLRRSMSAYLRERIVQTKNIILHPWCEVARINGADRVESVQLRSTLDQTRGRKLAVSDVFVMIGARPNAGFADGLCAFDDHGFVQTDDAFQTSVPGLFAVGDVRSGSTKRVANAAGEGSVCASRVWNHLNPA